MTAPASDGRVSVKGLALEGAAIGVLNNRTLEGVITSSPEPNCESTCPFEVKVAAESGDSLRVWQFFEVDSPQDVPVPEP